MDTKRKKYIDIAKYIAMILVIHNHFWLSYDNSLVQITIASFHMPLFFILSGMTFKKIDDIQSLKKHIIKRVIFLIFPYYLWSFIYSGLSIKNILLIFYASNQSIGIAGGAGGSWFIPCFFVSDLLCAIILYIFKNNRIFYSTIFLFTIGWMFTFIHLKYGLPYSFDIAFTGAGFIFIGFILNRFDIYNLITKQRNSLNMIVCIGALIITVCISLLNKTAWFNDYGRIVMALGNYGNYLLFFLGGLFGSICVIILSILLENSILSSYMSTIGMNTFNILFVQQSIVNIIEKLFLFFNIKLYFILPILFSFIAIQLCYLTVMVIISIYPNLVGKGILNTFKLIKE